MTLNDSKTDGLGSERALRATLRQMALDSPRLEEELLAERIELEADAWLKNAWTPSLSALISAVPLLRSRPLAMDAAIDAVLRCQMAQGVSLKEAAKTLRRDAPEFLEEIDTHMALRSLMSSTQGVPQYTQPQRAALPTPFGPVLKDGRQRYELVEFVGSGSEGSVFRAFDRFLTADGRPSQVAVKQLHVLGQDSVQRVCEEAARALRVRHPSIAAMLHCSDTEGCPFLVYEFIEGEPLDRWRRNRSSIEPSQAAEIIRRLAEGVQAAHNAGVVHRDLKPNNILLQSDSDPFITDFGLAGALSENENGIPGGSMAFAAPEQMAGVSGGTDAPVDIYALGGLLFWLLTGKYPNGETIEQARNHLVSKNPMPRVEPHQASWRERTLYRICEKALVTEPRDRYSSAGLLATDLARWLAHEPVLPFEHLTHQRVALAVRRSPLTALALCVAAVVALAALGYGWKLDANHRQARFALEREQLAQQVYAAQVLIEEKQRRIDNAGALVSGFTQVLRATQSRDGDTSWLPILTAMESLSGANMLALPDLGDGLVDSRLQVVAELLAKAKTAGTRGTIEMTMWETALGYWLLRDEQFEEAQRVLALNRERVERVFPASDPWIVLAQTLSRVAEIKAEPEGPNAADARVWVRANLGHLPQAMQQFVKQSLVEPSTPASGDASH